MEVLDALNVAEVCAWLERNPDAGEEALRRPYHERGGRVLVGEEAKQRRLAERLKPESEMTAEELSALRERQRVALAKMARRDERKRRLLKRIEERTAPARWQRVREKLKAVGLVRVWDEEMSPDQRRLARRRTDVLWPAEVRRLLWEMFEQGDKFDMKKWEPFRFVLQTHEARWDRIGEALARSSR